MHVDECDPIRNLIDASQHFRGTYQAVHLQIIEKRFGSDFVTFLLVDRTNADINHANTRAYTINQNMSWAERAFLIQAIEAAQTPEVRAGAAAVYAFWFGCASLEADKQVVQAKLAE